MFISITSLIFLSDDYLKTLNLPMTPYTVELMWYWFPLSGIFYMVLGMFAIKKDLLPGITANIKYISFFADLSFYVYLVHRATIWIAAGSSVFFIISTLVIASMLFSFDLNIKKLISHWVT